MAKPRGLPALLASELGYGLAFLRRHPYRLLLPFVGVLLPLWAFAALATELREGEAFFFDVPILAWLHTLASELGYGLAFLRRHPYRLLLPFVGVLLPLWGFAALATELREGEAFFFDVPILAWLHTLATPRVDAFFQVMSQLGYLGFVVPADGLLLGWLTWRRRYRDGLFFGLAVLGSLALNIGGKAFFARTRPDLWLSIAPEATYSFPSGHAMGSATLAVAATLLAWHTRWRWPVAIVGGIFVLLVGTSRVYLGVHFPSDILAGWAAATAWVVAMYQLTAIAPPPPAAAAPRKDTIAPVSAAASRD